MEFLLAFSIATNIVVVALLFLSRKDEARERQAMLAEAQNERARLLDRIQAPEAAVALSLSDEQELKGLDNVKFDDDEDFNRSMKAVTDLEREFGVVE